MSSTGAKQRKLPKLTKKPFKKLQKKAKRTGIANLVDPPTKKDKAKQQTGVDGTQTQPDNKRATKKRRRPKKIRAAFEASQEHARKVGELTPAQQADWLWESYSETTQATQLERGPLTGDHFHLLPCEGTLEQRIQALQPDWPSQIPPSYPHGAPTLITITSSAVVANDLVKQLPSFNKVCRIGKLFAKHFKVSEQCATLRTHPVIIASGTPNRLSKLVDEGALKLHHLKWVLVDVALDAKQRTILDVPETRTDLWQLYDKHLKGLLESGSTKICLFRSTHVT